MSSADSGFVLSDVLVSIVIVSILAGLVYSAVQVLTNESSIIERAYQTSSEHYEDALMQIGECICQTQPPEDPSAGPEEPGETAPDTSSNSF